MAVGYTVEVESLYDDNDSLRVYGVTALTLAGTTLTMTTTSYAGPGSTVVSMISATSVRLYKGATLYGGQPGIGTYSTHTSGSSAFDAKTTTYTFNACGVSSI